MKFGGPTFEPFDSPETWVKAVQAEGYSAAFCPVGAESDDATLAAYAQAAQAAGIVIAETGAWSNPLSADPATAQAAFELCCTQLDLAERIGARCCVNISGSRGDQWDGPHAQNLTPETFDRVVESTRKILDAVQPTRAYFTLETMPWMYPDSVDSYDALVEAMDRPFFGVHFDPVNLICSPQRYYQTTETIQDFVARLGPSLRSCHAKDILLQGKLTTHLDEVLPGTGNLDYATLLRELSGLADADVPLMLEHLPGAEEFRAAAQHIRSVAAAEGVSLV